LRSPACQAWQHGDVAVYVDDAHIRARGRVWSHLVADTADELHEAAAKLGLRREWAQDKGRTLHYDVPSELRDHAIAAGVALPITWQELVSRRETISPLVRRINP
jgi:Protein of unknown function (DUF4031)